MTRTQSPLARGHGRLAVAGACAAIFWPGAFIFSLPGVLGGAWQEAFGVGRAEIGRSMFFLLAGAGTFMYVVGRFQERVGTHRLAAAGALLTGTGTVLLGRVTGIGGVYAWAFAMGAASAFVYIPGLTVVQQHYPENRGVVAGLVNMCFGLSAAIMSPVFGGLLPALGPLRLSSLFGAVALVSGLAAAPLLRGPRAATAAHAGSPRPETNPSGSMTVGQSLRTRSFWCLWGTWALAGSAGISMVTLSTAFGADRGLSVQEAVVLLTAFNLTGGASRIVSGFLSDRYGRRRIMALAFAAAGLAYWALPVVHGVPGWAFLAAVVGYAFGTLFAVSAPLASERFGLAHFGAVFGLIFTAYGFLAGALGPWLGGLVLDATGGDFRFVFGYLGAFLMAAAALIMGMGPAPGAGRGGESRGLNR